MKTNEEIYLRILADLQFMSEIIDIVINEEGSFGGKMLRERIAIEREALRLEQDRSQREQAERNANFQEVKERMTDD